MKNSFIGLHLDFVGFSASVLCIVHCLALPFLVNLAPLIGLSFINNPWVEMAIILVSFCVASFALVQGYRKQHQKSLALIVVTIGFIFIAFGQFQDVEWNEILLTSCGSVLIATAHIINWRLSHQSSIKCAKFSQNNNS
ncbi:MerC domain-containing protein [Chondrinema litorale]|uniref:MerC domain-containing protein n=1 Tax=Chondrinema litorale TaxID=2994555 RepID=UPI002542F46C|nr:MerC domain-containing protein [Chondrinema litorale]UZR98373.1 MerC domain-containing protein [Chondrinema litorale]